ncbi:MAG: threonine synthase [Acidobacteria bacterium]|nr:threonine synthase [Acidobacteriota bacterium]
MSAYLQCINKNCQEKFPINNKIYHCPKCDGLLDVNYDFPKLEAQELKNRFRERRSSFIPIDQSGVWRFRELIPFLNDERNIVTLFEGNTPVYDAPKSASYAGLKKLLLKHQGLNPTGSFKDNGMATGIAQAKSLGAKAVACASTGNTSASMAAYAARAGMLAAVFIPSGQIAYGKLSQSLDYGAKTLQIDGDFDLAMQLVLELSQESELYLLNSINPFRLEGQKTIAIELLEQCAWQVPDRIVVPGGNLGNSSAIGKALAECYQLGLIDRMPKMHIIQAEGANPLAQMWSKGERDKLLMVEKASTLATAIKIGNPVSWQKALRALDWCKGGGCHQVSEQEIADAKAIIGSDGIGSEPASAVTLAGIRNLVSSGIIDKEERVVAILTGNLLKDPDYTVNYHLDSLYQKSQTKIEIISQQDKILANFANRPVQVAAEKNTIKQVLGL